jgi:hypothetical protein
MLPLQTISSVDLAILQRPQDTPIHALEGALRCRKCAKARWRSQGVLHSALR